MNMLTPILMTLVATVVLPCMAQEPPAATVVTAEEIGKFLAGLTSGDRPIRYADLGGYRVGIYAVHRSTDAADRASMHQTNIAEIYYILEGSGTLVTGGKLREPTETSDSNLASMTNVRSNEGIDGGVTRRVGPGDIIVIPGGVPHWWSERDGAVSYLIFRPDPDNKLNLDF